MEPYTFPSIVAGLSLVFIVWALIGFILPEFFAHRKAIRNIKHPISKKPTKKEIQERNTVNYLLMSDEMDEQIKAISLDEHEKALA